MLRAAALLALVPLFASAQPLTVSVNGTVGGRWLDEHLVRSAHQRASLSGGDLAFGGSVELSGRLSRLRLGGQLALDALESPRGLDVARNGPLQPLAQTGDTVTSALFFTAAPFAGLAIGRDEAFHGWLDLLVAVELLSAKVEGERMLGVTASPTLRLGFAVELGDVGVELSLLGGFLGTTRVALALGLRL
ncbi:MAG: hypothetical protein ACOZQL_04770 [Myxococcota bacterium]